MEKTSSATPPSAGPHALRVRRRTERPRRLAPGRSAGLDVPAGGRGRRGLRRPWRRLLQSPGPRLVDGVEILAEILHPEIFPRRQRPGDYIPLRGAAA